MQYKVPALALTVVLSFAVLWPSAPPSQDEIWAYRVGYGLGQTSRTHGGPDDPEDVARGMDGMSKAEYAMFESGFTHGRKGRSAKYDVPESFERFSQPQFPFTGEMAGEFAKMHGFDDLEPVNETPTPDQEERSATGDYAINALYGESPPKQLPAENNSR